MPIETNGGHNVQSQTVIQTPPPHPEKQNRMRSDSKLSMLRDHIIFCVPFEK